MERKKAVEIVEAFGGGVLSMLTDLLNNVINEYDITVLYGRRKQTPENFEELFDERIKFIEIKNFTRKISPLKDIKAMHEIRQYIKQEKPDVVHLHSSKAGVIGRVIVNGNNCKLLYNPHGFSFLKKDDSFIKRNIYRMIEKMMCIINRKCTLIGCSEGEYKECLKLTKKSIHINNGVNIELAKSVKENNENMYDGKKLKVCTVGRIGYQKNPELFNQIAIKNNDISFLWIGDGELRDKLNSENICITGWKNREEVLSLINKSDVFILTSLWEGLPISLLEAMALGKLCIVSDVIGNNDVIKNNVNGFVCSSVCQYTKILDYVKNNFEDSTIKKIKEQAYNDIELNYNVQNMLKKYLKIYKEKIK